LALIYVPATLAPQISQSDAPKINFKLINPLMGM